MELRKQYHSVNFGNHNSWETWHLVPLKRPVINPPEIKTDDNNVTGEAVLGNRKGSVEFMVMNGYDSWYNIYNGMVNTLHGKIMNVWLDDDPASVYKGRITVSGWDSGKEYSTVTVDYDLLPFVSDGSGSGSETGNEDEEKQRLFRSVNFGSYNTWTSWKLISLSVPVINPPPVKTKYVDIPGGNGSLDLTSVLTGNPLYGNRTGSFEFTPLNGYENWNDICHTVMNAVHGKTMNVSLQSDPDAVYTGRITVSGFSSGDDSPSVTIDYSLLPFTAGTSDPPLVNDIIMPQQEGGSL